MSLPRTASGLKPRELRVYTIEECPNCKQKTKRDFKVGDYIVGMGGACEKCHAQRIITLIYGERAFK